MCYTHVLQAIETGQMLDFVPSIRKLPNTRYCCRNLEFFPNPNISNIRQLFSAENTAENVFVVTLTCWHHMTRVSRKTAAFVKRRKKVESVFISSKLRAT